MIIPDKTSFAEDTLVGSNGKQCCGVLSWNSFIEAEMTGTVLS